MSESSSFQSTWSLGDHIRDADQESKAVGSSGRFEENKILDYGPFGINSILSSEDLEFIKLNYQIPANFRLEVINPREWIALPR